jgi:hypothetical protein
MHLNKNSSFGTASPFLKLYARSNGVENLLFTFPSINLKISFCFVYFKKVYLILFLMIDGNSPNWLQIELEIPNNLNQYEVIFEGNLTTGILFVPIGGISLGDFYSL